MGNAVTKNWRVRGEGGEEHVIQLRHHTFSGRREVIVDGEVTWTGLKFLDDGDELEVKAGGRSGVIIINVDAVEFDYRLVFNGEEVDDLVSAVSEFQESDLRMAIPRVEVRGRGEKGKDPLVVYRLEVEGGERRMALWKRFSDFVALDDQVRSSFSGNHLAANIPALPPKYPKFLYDHGSDEFVEARREALETYIRKLVLVPKVLENPDMQRFLTPRKKAGAKAAAAAAAAE